MNASTDAALRVFDAYHVWLDPWLGCSRDFHKCFRLTRKYVLLTADSLTLLHSKFCQT